VYAGGVGRLVVGSDFVFHVERAGIDLQRGLIAWHEMWRFIFSLRPDLAGRIATCGWCGNLYIRYHRKDVHCSTVCGQSGQLIRPYQRSAFKRGRQALEHVVQFERERRQEYGELEDRLSGRYRKVFKTLVSVVIWLAFERLVSARAG
jgi:hypothetical protein